MTFALHLGDAAAVMREKIASRSVDMVYSDPPFGNEQVWKGKAGSFDDRWDASDASRRGWHALQQHSPAASVAAAASRGDKKTLGYIGAMAGIILEVHRVLKPTGTLWLHFDDTMGAELRLLCDVAFGPLNAAGTLVWKRAHGGKGNAKGWGRVHDTIACYARTRAAFWRLWRIGTLGGDPLSPGWHCRFDDFATAAPLGSGDAERVGYPTQKPVALLTELIGAATLKGDTVLDPTCGSGTTLVAALKLDRRAIGIDQSPGAIKAARSRIDARPPVQEDMFADYRALQPA